MERVHTLAENLKAKLDAHASVADVLQTVRMIESELLHLQSKEPQQKTGPAVMILKPAVPAPNLQASAVAPAPQPEQKEEEKEKIVDVLQIDEAEVEAELEEIRRNAEERNKIGHVNKPAVIFDTEEDEIPTLVPRHQAPVHKELNEKMKTATASLNDLLAAPKPEVAEAIPAQPVKDLRKAVGVNDRYLFINELFRGDEAMYERSIKTINGFSIFAEAEFWIRRELKLKLGWNEKNDTVQQFDQLVRRRFS